MGQCRTLHKKKWSKHTETQSRASVTEKWICSWCVLGGLLPNWEQAPLCLGRREQAGSTPQQLPWTRQSRSHTQTLSRVEVYTTVPPRSPASGSPDRSCWTLPWLCSVPTLRVSVWSGGHASFPGLLQAPRFI